jgi:hypothetical protein
MLGLKLVLVTLQGLLYNWYWVERIELITLNTIFIVVDSRFAYVNSSLKKIKMQQNIIWFEH